VVETVMPFYAKPACLCLFDFKCNNCIDWENQQLEGYGYRKADIDGFSGEIVTPKEHKAEEFEAALVIRLDAKPI